MLLSRKDEKENMLFFVCVSPRKEDMMYSLRDLIVSVNVTVNFNTVRVLLNEYGLINNNYFCIYSEKFEMFHKQQITIRNGETIHYILWIYVWYNNNNISK